MASWHPASPKYYCCSITCVENTSSTHMAFGPVAKSKQLCSNFLTYWSKNSQLVTYCACQHLCLWTGGNWTCLRALEGRLLRRSSELFPGSKILRKGQRPVAWVPSYTLMAYSLKHCNAVQHASATLTRVFGSALTGQVFIMLMATVKIPRKSRRDLKQRYYSQCCLHVMSFRVLSWFWDFITTWVLISKTPTELRIFKKQFSF